MTRHAAEAFFARAGALLLLAGLAPTQGSAPGRGGPDLFPLGGLGLEVDLAPAALRKERGLAEDKPALLVGKVHPGEPAAKAGVVVGDLLAALDGAPLEGATIDECLRKAEEAVEHSEEKAGKLVLGLRRAGGKEEALEAKLPILGPHAATCPRKCPKCEALLRQTLLFLVKAQEGEGSWATDGNTGGTNGKVALTTLAGLALAHGRGLKVPVDAPLQNALSFVMRNAGKEPMLAAMRAQSGGANWSQVNWALAYGPLLLCHAGRGKPQGPAKAKLQELVQDLAANQEPSGGYAHGPGGPNALDYVELEIVSNLALLAFQQAARAGAKVPAEALERAVAYVDQCTTKDGGVAYSTRPGQAGHGDPGRTGGAWLALDLLGMGEKRALQAAFFLKGLEQMPEGHVSPVMHLLYASMACWRMGDAEFGRYWSLYRPYLMASRTAGGAYGARPTRETRALRTNMDRNLGAVWCAASYALVLEAGMGRLPWLREDKGR